MAYSSVKFLGLSVTDVSCSLGWGANLSQLSVKLVQDDTDSLVNPGYGQPVYFELYGFRFYGLLQSLKQLNSLSGLPTYEAIAVDPREILEGAKLITNDYNGSVSSVKNLINVYGWAENAFGYGGSQSNSSGMPWYIARRGLLTICNTAEYGPFGGPLTFMGNAYSLDLSELPVPPTFYRIPGDNLSLLEAIQIVCEDSGCDFFVELVGYTIKIRVVSRYFEPPLGTISALTASSAYSGIVSQSDSGVEVRNETTSTFLVGGKKTSVFVGTNYASYWGNDLAGNPNIGTVTTHTDFTDQYCESFNLNAADCADILGQVYYSCNTIEIRFALQGPESWAAYIAKYKPTISALIETLYIKSIPFVAQLQHDLINDSASALEQAVSSDFQLRFQRLYDLVRKAAEDFYGKQFLVQVPDINSYLDNETGFRVFSYEPTQSGWTEFGSGTFGIPFERASVIEDSDGRILPFVHYTNLIGANLSQLNWQDTAVSEGGYVWSRINIDNKVTYVPDIIAIPCVKVRLSNPIFDNPVDEYGDISLVGRIYAANALANVNKNGFGGTVGHVGIHPACRQPAAIAIPLKSNTESYGPWYIAGNPGKIKFEKDETLTPWDYGSTASMNYAADSKVLTAITNMQLSESGSIKIAGAPNASLGDVLSSGGPNVTDISIEFGIGGVTTNYRFSTFTQRFGLFSRQNSERIKKVSLGVIEMRKQLRKALNRAIVTDKAFERARRGAKANKTFYTKKESPHTIIMGQSVNTGTEIRTIAGTETYESALNLLKTGYSTSGNYVSKGMASWSSLVRAFTTDTTSPTGGLAKFETVSGFSGTNYPITNDSYNPYQYGHDIEIVSHGTGYSGAHAYHRGADNSKTRGIALRGPIVIEGWGHNNFCQPMITGTGNGGYYPNTLRRSDLWKVGSVDFLWDDMRKVWTSHDVIVGNVSNTISGSGGTGLLYAGGTSGWSFPVTNPCQYNILSGQKAFGFYCFNEHKWNVMGVTQVTGNFLQSGTYVGSVTVGPYLTGVYCSGGNIYGVTGQTTITVTGSTPFVIGAS